MLYQILDGTVTAGGVPVLSHINFEIKGNEKVALVGKNGAGKTTLLRLIAGELELDGDDKRMGKGITSSRKLSIAMLHQNPILPSEKDKRIEDMFFEFFPGEASFQNERFAYELEYDRLLTGFGFHKSDKQRPFSSFSGGEQTKLALIRLLLQRPDILLLDEPTNHLDPETVTWLERYIKQYGKAAVFVSHDRFFLDQTADVVYELSGGKLKRYAGNYTRYREEKEKNLALQRKAYGRWLEEKNRLEELAERFKHKPSKAAFARAKKKQAQRLTPVEKPEEGRAALFTGDITPAVLGSRWVFEAKHLKIGYGRPLLELSLRIRRGQKIGIIGSNGAGKSTFLKTVAGMVPPLEGKFLLGNRTAMGYFDQHSAEITSEKQVKEHFHEQFPSLTEKEARSILGAYLFGGKEAAKRVNDLSGGEKARLVLAEMLQSRPNFLLLDEPTNHMDIQSKETLESAFRAYRGTILFVSHDRYFIRQVADAILLFEEGRAMYYPFGYEHYLKHCADSGKEGISAKVQAEDQALIAGMRAVPKRERHRLREPGTKEAYLDWKVRLAKEQMEEDCLYAERLWEEWQEEENGRREQKLKAWAGHAPCGEGEEAQEETTEEKHAEKAAKLTEAMKRWEESCIAWYEAFTEQEEERK